MTVPAALSTKLTLRSNLLYGHSLKPVKVPAQTYLRPLSKYDRSESPFKQLPRQHGPRKSRAITLLTIRAFVAYKKRVKTHLHRQGSLRTPVPNFMNIRRTVWSLTLRHRRKDVLSTSSQINKFQTTVISVHNIN